MVWNRGPSVVSMRSLLSRRPSYGRRGWSFGGRLFAGALATGAAFTGSTFTSGFASFCLGSLSSRSFHLRRCGFGGLFLGLGSFPTTGSAFTGAASTGFSSALASAFPQERQRVLLPWRALAARFARSFTSGDGPQLVLTGGLPADRSCAPSATPMPTVSILAAGPRGAQTDGTGGGWVLRSHIWDVPPTSSHRCSQVPFAVPVIRSISLPECAVADAVHSVTLAHKGPLLLGLVVILCPDGCCPSFLADSTASMTLPVWAAMV